ncbi:Transcriptional regulatory protein ZraR [Crateriforma conspicua]|uniref:Transcriptional regulatory protein ZraR n=2 Tax=Planctomycetaceae TaxID=126 RepID=A0A5C5Y000_9PLAN|nr:sigma-54 dependent transcriptional regulator [Crateriforma conspicua]QDV63344.1 Transcriptional regulatory protein ZraR [Crateriforma conspicua]TWT67883.1 Transcriptional regulatory protein ZraR [Crateriforma conspicua]
MSLIGSSTTGPDEPLLPGIIGRSAGMLQVYRITRRVAGSNASVLILGETGVGKELIANAIHVLSHRSGGPFVKVNCGALSESLLESELFGHVRGAFTGAVANRAGRFEAAGGGTIFLDEINSTTGTLQVKLLRVLQEKEFERVGSTSTLHTDVRVVAASNRDLMKEVREDRFREDLYWRLNVVPIVIPPLRERRDDIPALVSYFLDYYNEINDRYVAHIGDGVIEAMQDYHWPGNVRELQNYIERAVVMAETDELTVDLLPFCVSQPAAFQSMSGETPETVDWQSLTDQYVERGLNESGSESQNVHAQVVEQVERALIAQVLQQCDGVQTKAAARLGINRNTLHKKIKDFGLGGE